MLKLHNRQEESVDLPLLRRNLLQIIEIKNCNQSELGDILGCSREKINNAITEKHASKALEIAAGLLLENLFLRNRLDAIEGAQRTLNALALNDVSSKLPPAGAMVVQPVKYVVPVPPKKRGGRKN